MRLIDADALRVCIMGEPPDAHYPSYYVDLVDKAPTLDVQPAQKGEWVHGRRNGTYGIWCSRCGTGWEESPNYEVIAASHNFCPHCGAMMRTEERHEPED